MNAALPISRRQPPWMPEILCCPRCKHRLVPRWHCSNNECRLEFRETAAGVPILIDFENSVISEESTRNDAPPGAATSRRLRNRLKSLTSLSRNVGGMRAMEIAGRAISALSKPRILNIGGGDRSEGLPTLLKLAPEAEVLNSDVYSGNLVHVLTDAHQLSFADESFDLVLIQAVLEHVLDPALVVKEIWRVLKAGGLVMADTPFLQAVHMGAYDFTRFTPLGQRALFRQFEELARGVSVGPVSALRWSFEHFVRALFRSKIAGMATRPLTLPLNLFERPASMNNFGMDACCGSYFVGRKSSKTLSPREIIASYVGAQ
jgi:SAM-dependent methyltransferase